MKVQTKKCNQCGNEVGIHENVCDLCGGTRFSLKKVNSMVRNRVGVIAFFILVIPTLYFFNWSKTQEERKNFEVDIKNNIQKHKDIYLSDTNQNLQQQIKEVRAQEYEIHGDQKSKTMRLLQEFQVQKKKLTENYSQNIDDIDHVQLLTPEDAIDIKLLNQYLQETKQIKKVTIEFYSQLQTLDTDLIAAIDNEQLKQETKKILSLLEKFQSINISLLEIDVDMTQFLIEHNEVATIKNEKIVIEDNLLQQELDRLIENRNKLIKEADTMRLMYGYEGYENPNKFIFHSQVSQKKSEEYLRFSKEFIKEINSKFFSINNAPLPISCVVFQSKEDFQQYLRDDLNISDPPGYGQYIPQLNTFFTYDGSGFGTFTHMILYPLMYTDLSNTPDWAEDVISTYFEKFFGYEKNGKMYFYWGFQNPWRIEQVADSLPNISLNDILSNNTGQSEKRLFSIFLHENNKFKKFISLIRQNDKKGFNTFLEAVFEMPLDEIQPLWKEYQKKVLQEKDSLLQIPASTIFSSEKEFKDFIKDLKKNKAIQLPSTDDRY